MPLDLFSAAVLGFVQGIAAWIPVSSKTQVILFGKFLFGLDFNTAVAFALLVHAGDLLATLYLFRTEFSGFARFRPKLGELASFEKVEPGKKLLYFALISTVFSGAIGLPLYLVARKGLSELPGTVFLAVVGATLVSLGLFMYFSSKSLFFLPAAAAKAKKEVTLADTAMAGAAQGLAVLPGISRSGITESVLLLRGYEPKEAVKLSFFMSVPMVILAMAGFFALEGFSGITASQAAIGIAASFFSSIAMMRFMLSLAEKAKFYYFNIAIGLLAMTPLALQFVGLV